MSEPLDHARAFELLPWFINGSLAGEEREAVELHLRSCLPCRRELKEQRRLSAALRLQPAVHLSPQNNFEKLSDELYPSARELLPRARRFAPLQRYAAVGAAGAALLAALFWFAPSAPSRFDAADYSTLAAQRAPSAGQIDIVFVQSLTAAEMHTLLEEIGAQIAAGPSAIGRYTLRLNAGTTDAEIAALIARLDRDPRVRFAGPALGAEPSP